MTVCSIVVLTVSTAEGYVRKTSKAVTVQLLHALEDEVVVVVVVAELFVYPNPGVISDAIRAYDRRVILGVGSGVSAATKRDSSEKGKRCNLNIFNILRLCAIVARDLVAVMEFQTHARQKESKVLEEETADIGPATLYKGHRAHVLRHKHPLATGRSQLFGGQE